MGNELTTKLNRTVLIQMFNSIHHKNFIIRKRYKAYIKLYHLISFGCKDESEKQSEINIPWRISYIFSFSYFIKQLHLPFLSIVQLFPTMPVESTADILVIEHHN